MTAKKYLTLTVSCLATLWGVSTAHAQVSLRSNEVENARFTDAGKSQEWTVELKQDGVIRFEVTSDQLRIKAFLYRNGNIEIPIFPNNGRGGRTDRVGVSANAKGELEAVPAKKELPAGRYTIKLVGGRGEVGAYKITLLEPTFVEVKKKDKEAPRDLLTENEMLKKKITDLESEIAILKKLILEKK